MVSSTNNKHYKLYLTLLIIILFASSILCSTLGTANISFLESLQIILHNIPFISNLISVDSFSSTHTVIILNIRLPRIILSGIVGMGLSIVGAAFQAMFKNPMADPYVLGVSSGSALGAALAIVTGMDNSFSGLGITTLLAFAGAIITTIIVYSIAKVGNKVPINTLLLSGISVSFLLSSLISLLMVFNRESIEKIIFWTMGSVSTASWNQVIMLSIFVIIGLLIFMIFSRDLNIMLTGDETAKSLGIEVENLKKITLIISSLVVAACVSVSGVIGFVGLIIPHIIRILLGPDHRILIPFSAVGGALFMILSDTLARTLASPAEIPVGAITSVIGAPYFIYLLIKNKRKV
ncbi:iron chelate uptake ABC transporter family permease subunit [Clostridium sp. CX1]|uniref:Iron chelate uptake ABC transporter family permease subunit n=1 Tax=Clostridium tanneri TaxID=3037988 RepID=A0ABU4JSX9_9CLOT|nr:MULTISPECIES: iron chelate uptake ABC transporter family permease subunit [unclassified Clostridium]MCT8978161.1 iron chelate uptake ABC transporter family permease subunit [Clostridium sp. CX1]MDW8801225.1 iron chelate uptake ABC transporter family permease subunit [Clostridium sp. A1-XYC3]